MHKVLVVGLVLAGMVFSAGCDVNSILGALSGTGDEVAKMVLGAVDGGTSSGAGLLTQTRSQLQDGTCDQDCDGTPDQIQLQLHLQDGSCLE